MSDFTREVREKSTSYVAEWTSKHYPVQASASKTPQPRYKRQLPTPPHSEISSPSPQSGSMNWSSSASEKVEHGHGKQKAIENKKVWGRAEHGTIENILFLFSESHWKA